MSAKTALVAAGPLVAAARRAVPPSAIKDLALREVSPPTFLQGEIHEAVQHWKAYTARSLKAMDAKRLDDYRAYKISALAAFEKLVDHSTLPTVTGMTPAQIVELLKW